MTYKSIPLYLPQDLLTKVDAAAKHLGIPRAQCIRLSMHYGLSEVVERYPINNLSAPITLPKQAKRAWSRKKFAKVNLDEPVIRIEDLDEAGF